MADNDKSTCITLTPRKLASAKGRRLRGLSNNVCDGLWNATGVVGVLLATYIDSRVRRVGARRTRAYSPLPARRSKGLLERGLATLLLFPSLEAAAFLFLDFLLSCGRCIDFMSGTISS